MRVKVFTERTGWSRGRFWADWEAACECGEGLMAEDWRGVMEFALGHLSFSHPGKKPRPLWDITITDGTYSSSTLVLGS